MEGRRFLGGDLDPDYVETTRRRLVELAARPEHDEAGA
jgi:DNA modification methylase